MTQDSIKLNMDFLTNTLESNPDLLAKSILDLTKASLPPIETIHLWEDPEVPR